MATRKQSLRIDGDGGDATGVSKQSYKLVKTLPHRVRPDSKAYTILCFDGGGYRGYASLLVLKDILRRLQPEGPVFPYLYFDLICGTSTGGLIAIFLALLHLDIDTAIKVYATLGKQVFNSHLRGPRYFLLRDEKFNSKLLKNAVSEILDTYGDRRTLMEDPDRDRGCKCFVTTAYKNGNKGQVLLVRSYPLPRGTDSIPDGYKWTIMDAAMATVAAPTFFRAHRITREGREFYFEDAGAYGANNPTTKAWKEVNSDCFPNGGSPNCFVSIGTGTKGIPTGGPIGSNHKGARRVLENLFNIQLRVKKLSKGLVDQATDVQKDEELVLSSMKETDTFYYRFNPDQLEDIPLADYSATPRMEMVVHKYLLTNRELLKECSRRINSDSGVARAILPRHTRKWWRLGFWKKYWNSLKDTMHL